MCHHTQQNTLLRRREIIFYSDIVTTWKVILHNVKHFAKLCISYYYYGNTLRNKLLIF